MEEKYEKFNKKATKEATVGFLEALSNFYVSGYYLDLNKGKYVAISQAKEYSSRYSSEGDWSVMDDYIKECINEEDRALITEVSRIDYIRTHLKKEKYYSIEVRDYGTGTERWYRYTTMRGRDENHAAIVFVDATDVILQRQKLENLEKSLEEQNKLLQENQSYLEESTAEQEAQLEEIIALNDELQKDRSEISNAFGMIEGFSKEFHTIWLVDKETSLMRLIRSNGKSTIKNAVQMGKDLPAFDDGFNKYIETYIEPEDRKRMHKQIAFDEILRQLEEKPDAIYSVNYLRRDDSGHVGYHQIAFANADSEDGKKQFVYGFRDIDQIVKEEKKQKEELKKAKEAADEANAAKSRFLFSMSHDIRTPMNAIIGYTNLIEKYYDDKERCMGYLSKEKQANQFLLSLINDVLEMARIESGKAELDETVSPVGGIAREISAIFEDQMAEKGITFINHVETHTKWAYYDQAKVREIYLNILSNALKYTDKGGKVTLDVKEIPSEKPGTIKIKAVFADTGIGMSEEFLPHIFESFVREKSANGKREQGTGLGMPIVKKILDLLGGTIEVESKPGKGSTFTVIYPLRVAESEPISCSSGVENADFDFNGKHVLLAEDNDFNAEIATEILTDVGLVVDRASDGKECVDIIEKSEAGSYDLILMDIQMPGLNGYEATREIRRLSDATKANIPIIAMTANAFQEDKSNALEAGMDGHIAKPVNIPILMKVMEEILATR